MDPEANLAEQLKLANYIIHTDENAEACPDSMRLAELVIALDGWIKGGGFLPDRWKTSIPGENG